MFNSVHSDIITWNNKTNERMKRKITFHSIQTCNFKICQEYNNTTKEVK